MNIHLKSLEMEKNKSGFSRLKMGPLRFKAIVKYKKEETNTKNVFHDDNERQKYRKRFEKFTTDTEGSISHPKG